MQTMRGNGFEAYGIEGNDGDGSRATATAQGTDELRAQEGGARRQLGTWALRLSATACRGIVSKSESLLTCDCLRWAPAMPAVAGPGARCSDSRSDCNKASSLSNRFATTSWRGVAAQAELYHESMILHHESEQALLAPCLVSRTTCLVANPSFMNRFGARAASSAWQLQPQGSSGTALARCSFHFKRSVFCRGLPGWRASRSSLSSAPRPFRGKRGLPSAPLVLRVRRRCVRHCPNPTPSAACDGRPATICVRAAASNSAAHHK